MTRKRWNSKDDAFPTTRAMNLASHRAAQNFHVITLMRKLLPGIPSFKDQGLPSLNNMLSCRENEICSDSNTNNLVDSFRRDLAAMRMSSARLLCFGGSDQLC